MWLDGLMNDHLIDNRNAEQIRRGKEYTLFHYGEMLSAIRTNECKQASAPSHLVPTTTGHGGSVLLGLLRKVCQSRRLTAMN
jgi:hypothetical protein